MDVGLVCDTCSTFNKMGAKLCSLCGDGLSLDVPGQSIAVDEGGAPAFLLAGAVERDALASARSQSSFSDDYTRRGIPLTEPSYVSCPTCSSDVIAGHKFCGHCGARMDVQGEGSAGLSSRSSSQPAVRNATADAVRAPSAASARQRSQPTPGTRGGRSTQFFGAMQASRAKLVVIKGDGMDGVSFTLAGDEHLVGRVGTPILFPDDSFISPVHANFYYDTGNLLVRDESSINGVFTRIRGSVAIRFGARFLVGEQVLEVQEQPRAYGPEAMDDGTYFFASPPRPTYFRIMETILGGITGMVYHARKPSVSIGRENNDINFPNDPFISARHAVLSLQDDQLTLTDLDSKNGTFLRIQGEQVLQHGDYVFMGQQLLRVEIV